jgi:hypothetical protein
MKRSLVLSMVIAGAVGLGVWPTYAERVRAANVRPEIVAVATRSTADARPEALATGGALLVLASILRRNVGGRVK